MCVRACVCACMRACVFVHVHMRTYVHVCVRACVHVCLCVIVLWESPWVRTNIYKSEVKM